MTKKVVMTPRVVLSAGSRWSNLRKKHVRITLEVKVAKSMPKSQFLHITCEVSRDIEGSANDMDLRTTTQVVPSPVHSTLQESEVRQHHDDPLVTM